METVEYRIARKKMVQQQLIPRGVKETRVLEAMLTVPRHRFVSSGFEDQAYLDRALHIGEGQTISQPLIVALMTQALQLNGREKVLEIGTGSGYQTAILSWLADRVFTIERVQSLSIRARKTLYQLTRKNITFRIGDGTLGWSEESPFDAIMVTAGGPTVPATLKEQLAVGGRMVIPVGSQGVQNLCLIRRTESGFGKTVLSECRFVKLIGEEGWKVEG